MNENARKWVAALRSGEFEQGEHFLRSFDDEYCCLGVLCETYRRETGKGEWVRGSKAYTFFTFEGALLGANCELPRPVRLWARVRDAHGVYGRFLSGSLVRDNDSKHRSFDRIAKKIESEPKGLFQ